MKKYILPILAAALSLGAVSCQEDMIKPPYPEISVDLKNLSFGYGVETKELTVTTNREWSIESDADWLAFDPERGGEAGQTKEYKVKVTVLENTAGNERSTVITINTAALYVNSHISQASNPDAAPVVLYQNDFGIKPDGDNPYIGKSSSWFGPDYESGYASQSRKFYADSDKLTVRNTSANVSTGYVGASGNNYIHFGSYSSEQAGLAIELPVHQDIRKLTLQFGILRVLHTESENTVDLNEFSLWVSKDGEKWVKLDDILTSPIIPKVNEWVYCSSTLSLSEAVGKLYFKFYSLKGSPYCMDDLKISCSTRKGNNVIDWTAAIGEDDLSEEDKEEREIPLLSLGTAVSAEVTQ